MCAQRSSPPRKHGVAVYCAVVRGDGCSLLSLPINLVTKLAVLHGGSGGRVATSQATGVKEMGEMRGACGSVMLSTASLGLPCRMAELAGTC
jgi:hypothetical protein